MSTPAMIGTGAERVDHADKKQRRSRVASVLARLAPRRHGCAPSSDLGRDAESHDAEVLLPLVRLEAHRSPGDFLQARENGSVIHCLSREAFLARMGCRR